MLRTPRRILSLCLLALFFTAACASTDKEKKVDEGQMQRATAHYQLGLSYLNNNDIQPAFVEFHKALELNPNDREVLNAIGVIYLLKLEDYHKAIEYFQKALKIDKNFSEASLNLGVAYEKMNRYQEAVDSYKAALTNQLYMGATKAFNNLGRVYYRMKQYDDAVNAYKEAIKRFPSFHPSYYGLALCFNALGRYGDAAVALKKAIELDPAYRGDGEKARKDFTERRLFVRSEEEKDLDDLIDIMHY